MFVVSDEDVKADETSLMRLLGETWRAGGLIDRPSDAAAASCVTAIIAQRGHRRMQPAVLSSDSYLKRDGTLGHVTTETRGHCDTLPRC